MSNDQVLSSDANGVSFLCVQQPVLVQEGVVDVYPAIVSCDVIRYGGTRNGVAWIHNRQAEVYQRYPGYDPSYEWVFERWVDAG